MQPIFARITKIDEETRTVTGRAAQEMVDRDNEVFDYASSKPEFMKWSAECSADTNGKSLGNVRSMHGNCAAGKLTDIEFNDAERAIDIEAKIVDDGEWKKCLAGVHTGFSIGGRYSKKWADVQNGKVVTRYTAVPAEISLVDRPCIPTAKFFEVHKRNGSVEKRAFQRTAEPMSRSHGGAYRGQFIEKCSAASAHTAGLLQKARREARQLIEGLEKANIEPVPALRALAGNGHPGVAPDSVDAILKIHRQGFRKGFPPQSANGIDGGPTADDGASGSWSRDSAPRNSSTQMGTRHAASIGDGRLPATQTDDPTVAALKAIFARGPSRF